MQRLLCPVDHAGYAEGSLFAILLQNKNSPKRKRRITPPLHRRNRIGLCLRCFPDDLVYTGCILTYIFRHSLNGYCFAAKRVGQQPLQGFHLIVFADLCCLHNTRLQPPYLTLNINPTDVIPRHVKGRTRQCCSVHLLSLCLDGSANSLVKRDHKEVCALSRGVMFQPLSVPLQNGVRFVLVPVLATP